MILMAFCFAMHLLLKAKCYHPRIETYLPIYNSTFAFMQFTSPLRIPIDGQYNLSILNPRAIRLTNIIDVFGTHISFYNSLYAYVFDVLITHHNEKVFTRERLIIEHAFDRISFDLNTLEGIFALTIDHDKYNCKYAMLDILDSELLSALTRYQHLLCDVFGSLTSTSMRKVVASLPPHRDQMNWMDFILKISDESKRVPFICDYRLNETFKVTDFFFANITYFGEKKQTHNCYFYEVLVDISYSMINKQKRVERSRLKVKYDHVLFGKEIFIFSYNAEAKESKFEELIKDAMKGFEKKRVWIDYFI